MARYRRRRPRRRNVLSLGRSKRAGTGGKRTGTTTRHPRRGRRTSVYSGAPGPLKRRRNPRKKAATKGPWVHVKATRDGKRRSHYRHYGGSALAGGRKAPRAKRVGKGAKRRYAKSRGRAIYKRRRNAGGRSRAARSRAAKLGWRRRRNGTKRGQYRTTARRAYMPRRSNRRRSTRKGMRRRTARRAYSPRRRRRNQGFAASLPRPLRPIANAVVPSLFAIGGLATGHWLSGMIAQRAPVTWNPKWVSVGSAAVTLGVAGWALPMVKAIPPESRKAILLGFGINFGLKILGAFLPSDSKIASFLLNVPGTPADMTPQEVEAIINGNGNGNGAKGWGQYGYGQPDIYAPSMMGMGAYVQSAPALTSGIPVEEAVAGFGAYITDTGETIDGFGGMGAYVQSPLAIPPGPNPVLVQEAIAGYGGFQGFDGVGDVGTYGTQYAPIQGYGNEVPSHMNGLGLDGHDLNDVALDAAEAGVEGLGVLHNTLQAQGGKLLYSTEEGAANLARSGYDVRAVKNSIRHPGVPVVAATPAGQQYQCPHCKVVGKAPSGAPVFRCFQCQQAVSAPEVTMGAGAGTPIPGGLDRTVMPPPTGDSGGMVGRSVPSTGVFQPLYTAG